MRKPLLVRNRRRFAVTLAGIVAVLAASNVIGKFGPAHAGLVLGPLAAAGLLAVARRHGLTWDDLGMGRRTWRTGAAYAAGAVALVAAGYAVAIALPAVRTAFLDSRYQMAPGSALLTALVVIPLGTVLLEEVAFRGVLLGLIHRHRGIAWATAASSVLFGLWHILPSLRLGEANPALGAAAGNANVLVVAGAVGFTAVAGVVLCELRRRSGSLLASAGLHWATNALAVLAATIVWALPSH